MGNWHKEASRFAPDLPVLIHHGQRRIKGADFKKLAGKHSLVISSFALLHRDLALLQEVPWAGVILDEAQNIKNPQTRQSQAARSLKAGFRVALTGTPVENHVGDLWAIMEFLNPGMLGTQAEFKRAFHVPIQVERDPEASKRLQRLTSPFLLRRLKTDRSIISDLPEKLEMKVYSTLTKEQASLYAAVVEDAANQIEESEGIRRKGLVLATLTKLKQVCNHPAQFLGDNSSIPDRSGKLARLTEMLDEALAGGDKALIFTQFTEMGDILRRHLEDTFGREVPFLHGGVPKIKRDRMVERFQSPGLDAPSVFLLSVKAGGVGLEPDGGQPRLPLRPLVEPRRREPGHRPRLPDRPDQERPDPQVRLPGDPRGEDRRDDRAQARGRRLDRGKRRGLAHQALDRRAEGPLRPPPRGPGD